MVLEIYRMIVARAEAGLKTRSVKLPLRLFAQIAPDARALLLDKSFTSLERIESDPDLTQPVFMDT